MVSPVIASVAFLDMDYLFCFFTIENPWRNELIQLVFLSWNINDTKGVSSGFYWTMMWNIPVEAIQLFFFFDFK